MSICLYVPICLPVKSLNFRNVWRYRVEIQTIFLNIWALDFLKKSYFYIYLKKRCGRAYCDAARIQGFKYDRALPVDYFGSGKNQKNIHLWLNNCLKRRTKFGSKAASSSEVSDERALAKLNLNFRKSSRSPIFVRNPRWASPTRVCSIS